MGFRGLSIGYWSVVAAVMAGCGGSAHRLEAIDTAEAGSPVVHYPGDGGIIIMNEFGPGSGRFTCVAPPAQSALGLSNKVSGSADVSSGSVTVGLAASAESNETIVKLADLNERSLFLQYALYRLCEATVNGHIGTPRAKEGTIKDVILTVKECELDKQTHLPRGGPAPSDVEKREGESLAGRLEPLNDRPPTSLMLAQTAQAYSKLAASSGIEPARRASARACSEALISKIDYNDFSVLYREVLATASGMHADSRKEAEFKLELAKLEAKTKSEEEKKKAELAEVEKKLRDAIRGACSAGPKSDDCEIAAKLVEFEPGTKSLKFPTKEFTFTPSADAQGSHVLKLAGGRTAEYKLPAGQWVAGVFGDFALIGRK